MTERPRNRRVLPPDAPLPENHTHAMYLQPYGDWVWADIRTRGRFEPIELPAYCTHCGGLTNTDVKVGPDSLDVEGEGPFACDQCGGDAYLPNPITIQERKDGPRYHVTRLDLVRKTVALALNREVTAEHLEQFRRLLEEAWEGSRSTEEVTDSLQDQPEAVRGYWERLLGATKDPSWAVPLIVSIISILLTIYFGTKRVDVSNEVVDRITEQVVEQLGHELELEDIPEIQKEEPRKVEKVGRNAPCPCGSGLKHKKCCLEDKSS